jgi:hypothetical protein
LCFHLYEGLNESSGYIGFHLVETCVLLLLPKNYRDSSIVQSKAQPFVLVAGNHYWFWRYN